MKLEEADPATMRRRLRTQMVEARLALADTTVATWSEAICRHLHERFAAPPGRLIGFCWPVKNEPDLRPILELWRAAGAVTCLPVVVDERAPLAFRRWQPGDAMISDRYGIPTPARGDFIAPDVLLLPLNAFDAAGFRLGYGGGFFDRTLAAINPRPLSIGVGFAMAQVESIAPEAHDQRLDWIVTEAGAWQATGVGT